MECAYGGNTHAQTHRYHLHSLLLILLHKPLLDTRQFLDGFLLCSHTPTSSAFRSSNFPSAVLATINVTGFTTPTALMSRHQDGLVTNSTTGQSLRRLQQSREQKEKAWQSLLVE